MPFLNNWWEVIINHMMSDTIRASKAAKRSETVSKYEMTYQTNLVDLVTWGSDRKTYESCIESIIRSLRSQNDYCYISIHHVPSAGEFMVAAGKFFGGLRF